MCCCFESELGAAVLEICMTQSSKVLDCHVYVVSIEIHECTHPDN
jgi:hypothetical protein